MYEKVKVENENSGVPEGVCNFCERPKSIVICSGCRHVVPNVRHRRTCLAHPREFFLMDIAVCRICKGKNLLEVGLDEISADLIAVLSPPVSPTSATSSGSRTQSPSPRPSSSSCGILSPAPPVSKNGRAPHVSSSGLSTIKENSNPVESMDVVEPNMAPPAPLHQSHVANLVPGRGRGLKRQRYCISQLQTAVQSENANGAVAVARDVPAPLASSSSTQALSPPPTPPAPVSSSLPVSVGGTCVCTRQVHFIVCANCGYYAQSVRKFVPCTVHPNETQGIKFCPECGEGKDSLDETCF